MYVYSFYINQKKITTGDDFNAQVYTLNWNFFQVKPPTIYNYSSMN